MHITLDGNTCEDLEASTIGEAIEVACNRAHEAGRIVVQVDVDDRTLDASELGDPQITSGTAGKVALTSLEPRAVLRASVDLGINAVEAANERFRTAAQALQSGKRDDAHEPLQEGLELWQTLDEHVLREAIPTVLMTIAGTPGQEAFGALVEELEQALSTIRAAMVAGDGAALSDSLLYEFPGTAERWKDFFSKCLEALDRDDRNKTEDG